MDPPLVSQQVFAGRYVLEREIGRGGMATVYLARDLRHDRPVTLKVLRHGSTATLGPGKAGWRAPPSELSSRAIAPACRRPA